MIPLLALLLAAPPDGYGEILARRVNAEGLVDYQAIAKEDLPKLDAYLSTVAKAELPKDENEALGFLIDAYNALVLRAVIREKLPRSVLDVKGFFSATTYTVAGRALTLDALEKELIAHRMKPLHHFLLVCGAFGCPSLEQRPIRGSDAKARAEAAAKRYLATPRGATVEGPELLRLSKIFDWYAADFGGPAGVLSFVRARLPPERARVLGPAPKVEHLDYNWTLNLAP
ncbi:MAG: DUF547 domain-containing protein [Myxococcota bacterium]